MTLRCVSSTVTMHQPKDLGRPAVGDSGAQHVVLAERMLVVSQVYSEGHTGA